MEKKPLGVQVLTIAILTLLVIENLTLKNYDQRSEIFSDIEDIGKVKLSFLNGKSTLHLPIYTTLDADIFGKNSAYLNWVVMTGERIMNGNTSYLPVDHLAVLDMFEQRITKEGLEILKQLGINYIVIHKSNISDDLRSQIVKNQNFFSLGKVIENDSVLIFDVEKYGLKPSSCIFPRDFEIKVGQIPPSLVENSSDPLYAAVLINKQDCYLVSSGSDRYRELKVNINGAEKNMHLKMPVVIMPKQQITLSELNREMRVE